MDRARQEGIERIYLPNIDVSTIAALKAISEKHPHRCFPMMGLHPCSVKDNYKEELGLLKEELDKGSYVAVGEIGVDLYWDKSFLEQQLEAFDTQITWAIEKDLPIVIHSRDSLEHTIAGVADRQNGNLRGIYHCFSGSPEDVAKILDLGFYFGLGGVLTFKNGGIDKIIDEIPLTSIVLETDAPYLAPVPFRGKRNEPSYMIKVAERLAELKGISIEEVASVTTGNAMKLFHREEV